MYKRVLGSSQIIDNSEFEYLFCFEANQLGVEKAYLAIVDKARNPLYDFSFNISADNLQRYLSNIQHDVYLQAYLNNRLFGSLSYLQEIVSADSVQGDEFNELIRPVIRLNHSVSGLAKLRGGSTAVFSTHMVRKPTLSNWSRFNDLWHLFTCWAEQKLVSREMATVLHRIQGSDRAPYSHIMLTPTERVVLELLVEGMDGSEIAKYRRVSKETVRSQIKQILSKTSSHSQNQLIARYFNGSLHYYGDS
ncbi:helix-turn-helix transcriptional regulator [Aliagarivorans marinus]|uniref:helix-turn-helix transcriptional regulator n=1 Tax=Aliagarivorans marinus TaxID=561965 RepID=UPI00047C9A3B|nr:helix-turn-helix transcriptional regulator [Aliagarivorans marinus]